MTNQEIFDKVCEKLSAQGRRSYGSDRGCLYNGPNGMHCAIGHLVQVDEVWEAYPVHQLPIRVVQSIFGLDRDIDLEFLKSIQRVHDFSVSLEEITEGMQRVARVFNLNPEKVDLFKTWESRIDPPTLIDTEILTGPEGN